MCRREAHPLDLRAPFDAVPVDPLHHGHAPELEEPQFMAVDAERVTGAEVQDAAQELGVGAGIGEVDLTHQAHLVGLG